MRVSGAALEAPDSGREPGLNSRDGRSREGSGEQHQDQTGGWQVWRVRGVVEGGAGSES